MPPVDSSNVRNQRMIEPNMNNSIISGQGRPLLNWAESIQVDQQTIHVDDPKSRQFDRVRKLSVSSGCDFVPPDLRIQFSQEFKMNNNSKVLNTPNDSFLFHGNQGHRSLAVDETSPIQIDSRMFLADEQKQNSNLQYSDHLRVKPNKR